MTDTRARAGGGAPRLVERVLGEHPEGFFAIVVLTILFVLGMGLVPPVLPDFVDAFSLSNTAGSLLLASFAAGRLLYTVPAGPVVDRYSFRTVTIGSGVVLAVAMGVAAASGTYLVLVCAQLVAGAASAQFTTAAMATLVDRTSDQARGRLLGAFQGLIVLVVSFSPTVGGFAASVMGIYGPFVVSAVGGAAGVAVAVVALGGTASSTATEADAVGPDATDDAGTPADRRADRQALFRLMRTRPFVLALLAGLAAMWSISGVRNTLFPLFAAESLGLPGPTIGVLLTVGSISSMAGLFPAGHALDAVGRRPVVRWGMVAVGLSSLGFVLVDSLWGAVVVLFAMGLARGVVSPAPSVVVADIADPRTRGTALALSRLGPASGLAVGPLVSGALSDLVGIRGAFLVSGLFLCALALATLAMPETLPRLTEADGDGTG